MTTIIPWALLVAALGAALMFGWQQARARASAEAEAQRLTNWLHHNLHAIRAHVAYAFPEAVSVCNSLETALPARCTVDLDGLERHLIAIRRAHNAVMIEAARHDRDKYRQALAELLELLRSPESAWSGPWEELDQYRALVAQKGGAK